jgi:hypothetical protein
MNALKNN